MGEMNRLRLIVDVFEVLGLVPSAALEELAEKKRGAVLDLDRSLTTLELKDAVESACAFACSLSLLELVLKRFIDVVEPFYDRKLIAGGLFITCFLELLRGGERGFRLELRGLWLVSSNC